MERRRTKESREAQERFGAALRLLRTSSGQGLRELARRLGLSATYLSRVEGGLEPPPSSDRLVEIARALGLSSDALQELAGRVAPDLIELLRNRPAVTRLLRALLEVDPPDEVVHALTRQLRTRGARPGCAPLAVIVGRAIAVQGARGDALDDVATALARLGADRARTLEALRQRGEITEASTGQRVALIHAEVPELQATTIVLVRGQGRPGRTGQLTLALAWPPGEASGRVAALGVLARLASDPGAVDAVERASPRAVLRVLRRELLRILGVSGRHDRGRPAA